ncbi:MAG: hypothetical protein GY835_01395 [bacterium]|nr:hypothetical protein [bacterium]
MKKRIKKLSLNRETIRRLDELESELVKGGMNDPRVVSVICPIYTDDC